MEEKESDDKELKPEFIQELLKAKDEETTDFREFIMSEEENISIEDARKELNNQFKKSLENLKSGKIKRVA